jgi:2-keto-4-pentenoate hydratase/2-oxohepta-3-ene-1,7-dioic acid hydratase in catechol pathway
MKLACFHGPDGLRLGVVDGDELIDVTAAYASLPRDTAALLGTEDGLAAVRAAAARRDAVRHLLADAHLAAPVPRPPKLLAIGLNYAAHVAESRIEKPEHQLWFNKQSTCVVGPGDPIHVPRASAMVDYEGELAFVIGQRCRHVPAGRAVDVIAGYTIVNDVSVRDWQFRTPTMTMGKSFDTHGPMGPWLVTGDELGDPHRLRLRTWVNGELRQDAKTDDLIFDCYEQVEHLSTAFTLEPGDVISTGTPAGVGAAMQPPQFLKAGDVVRIEIEGIGVLENPVIDEPDGFVA